MALTSGQAEVRIVPTMRGFQSSVRAGVRATKVDPLEIQVRLDKKALAQAEVAAREAAARVQKARDGEAQAADNVRAAETALADARKKAASDSVAAVEAAESRLEKSRAGVEAAAQKASLAELRLEEARSKSAEGSAAVVAAEQRVASARANQEQAASRVRASEESLNSARKSGASTADSVVAAENRLAQAKRSAVSASTSLARAMVDDESARNRVAAATTRLEASTARASSSLNRFRSLIASSFDDGSVRRLDKSMSASVGSALRLAAGASAAAGAVVGIGSAVGPVLALSSALVTAAGSAALIPAALAAAGSAFGTVKIGISGISEAFKGYAADAGAATKSSTDNAKTELSNAKQVRDAKKSISDAQRDQARTARDGAEQISAASARVTDAVEDEKRAQKELGDAYKEARRQLLDLQTSQVGYALDAESAQISYQRQQQRTAEIMRSSTATDLDKREAQNDLLQSQLRVTEASQRQKRGQEDLTDAERKGVAGSDLVVSAQDRLKDAQDNVRDSKSELARTELSVAEANQDAAARVSDAVQNLADIQSQQAAATDKATAATSKYNDALAKLSPNARAFVQAVIGLKDQWDALKNSVQDRMFAGFADEVKLLGNAQLPILKRGLTGISGGLNTAALEVSRFLRSTQGLNATEKILGNTSLATGNLARSAKPLTSIFMQFASIGSEFLPGLATGFSNAAERAERFVNSAAGAQKIREWISNGLEALRQLGQLAGNVAGIIGTVWSAMNAAGGSTLQLLVDLTGQAEAWLKSAEGQRVLTTIFTTMRDVVNELKPGVAAVLGAVKDAFLTLAPSLPGLAKAFSGIAEALAPLVTWIAKALKWFIDNALIPFGAWARENPGAMQTIAFAILGVVAAVKAINIGLSVQKWCQQISGAISWIKGDADKAAASVDGKKGLTGSLKALKAIGAIAVPVMLIWTLQEIADAYKLINDDVQRDPKTGQPVTPEQRSLKQSASDTLNDVLSGFNKNPLEGLVPRDGQSFSQWFFGKTPDQLASDFKNSFFSKLSEGADNTIGKWLDENIAFPVQNFFRTLPEKIGSFSDAMGNWAESNIRKPVIDKASSIGSSVGGFFTGIPGWLGSLSDQLGMWAETNIREPVVRKFTELKDGAIARVTEAKDWVVARLTELKDGAIARATEAKDWVVARFTELKDGAIARATEAKDWVVTRFTELKDWVILRATEAKDWVVTRFRELKDGAIARVTEAKDWVILRFTELKDWVILRATEARDWVVTRFRELKDAIIARATEAKDWVILRFTEAKDWIILRATEARDWVTTRFRELKDAIIARATEAKDWVILRFTEAKDWIIVRATEARDWVVTRFTELKDGAIARVTEAKDWVIARATELKDGFIGRITELKDTVIRRWDELRAGFRNPIRWVVDTVWNNGVGALWNGARKILPSLPEFARIDARFASGGAVRGPGTATSDSIPARLSNNEHVWTSAEVDAAGGHGYVTALREAALSGNLMRFATGGPVMWQDLWNTVRSKFPTANLNNAVRPGDPGEHGAGRAIDIGGPMLAINRWLAQMFPGSHELIHTPGINLFNGRPHVYDAPTRAGHYDHVHWANVAKNGTNAGVGGSATGFIGNWILDQITGLYDTATNPLRDSANRMFPGDALPQRIPRDMVHSVLDSVRTTLFGAADIAGGFADGGPTTGDMLGNARVIGNVGRQLGFGRNGIVVALATALQESGLRNLNHGDRDSVGLFQQRGNGAWGSLADRMNPSRSASMFFNALRRVVGWERMPVTVAAQRVQRSAFPDAYAKWVGKANDLATQVGFANGGVIPGSGKRDDKVVLAQSGERVLTGSQNAAFEDMVRANFGASAAVRASQRRHDLASVGRESGRGYGSLIGEFHAHQNVDVDTALQRASFEASARDL